MTGSQSKTASVDPAGEFWADTPEYFYLMVFQIVRRQDTRSEKLLKTLGLTLAAWRALLIIDRLQPCTMNALARVSAVERTTLTRTIDQLVSEGLAERCTPPQDRRQVQLSLTPAGVEMLDAGKTLIYADQRRALDGIDPDRLREATRLLRDVVERVVDDPVSAPSVLNLSHPERLEEG
jgi:DNA-binding MarR family transcriptional regulator